MDDAVQQSKQERQAAATAARDEITAEVAHIEQQMASKQEKRVKAMQHDLQAALEEKLEAGMMSALTKLRDQLVTVMVEQQQQMQDSIAGEMEVIATEQNIREERILGEISELKLFVESLDGRIDTDALLQDFHQRVVNDMDTRIAGMETKLESIASTVKRQVTNDIAGKVQAMQHETSSLLLQNIQDVEARARQRAEDLSDTCS